MEASVAATDAAYPESSTIDKDPAVVTTADASPQLTGRAEEPELVLALAAVTEPEAGPQPPLEEIPMESLMKQAEEVAVNAMASVVDKVTDKPNKTKTNGPASSPLARLLAMELNLNLIDIGKGTGKNGKILIADVRKFHARLEEARSSIVTSGAYFASVSA